MVTVLTLGVLPATAATTNLLSWKELDLNIEDNLSCTFDSVTKFKGTYYAFSSIQGSGSGVGEPFQVVTSDDGQNWNKVSADAFGDVNDIAIDSTVVWKNSAGKKHLYIAARNQTTGVNVYRTEDGKQWEKVISNGLDSKNNDRINVMVPFQGQLYMITENDVDNNANGARFFISETGNTDDWKVQEFNEAKFMSAPGALTGAKLTHQISDGSKETFFYFVAADTTLWRTADGTTWNRMPFNIFDSGYGVELINFNGYVYMATFDEFDTSTMTKLIRSKNPAEGQWEELDLGVTGEELITTFGKQSGSKAKYLWFGTYPSGYAFRIGKDTNQIERVSASRLGFEYGPKFPVGLIFTSSGLSIYDGTRVVWQRD
jgi:sucrose-6-phosphate hydrolase SacC (GH32 family)